MGFVKPPMMTGDNSRDIANLRDYLFRMAKSLDPVIAATDSTGLSVSYQGGRPVTKAASAASTEIKEVQKNAAELKSLIIKTANNVRTETVAREQGDANTLIGAKDYVTEREAVYGQTYVAQSEYGTFTQTVSREIEETNAGVSENYRLIEGITSNVSELQEYMRAVNGEILRGIVLDPSTGQYAVGIAISQQINVKATMSQGAAAAKPDDSQVYYEIDNAIDGDAGQTFGLYTSTGWQFWINGAKVAWLDSLDADGMLHVASVQVEKRVVHGGYWEEKTENVDGMYMFTINYSGS